MRVETLSDQRQNIHAHPEASDNPESLGVVDVVFLLAKTIGSEDALEAADPMISEETTIVTIQNGLLNKSTVASFVDESQILSGASRLGANKNQPAQIQQMATGETIIGGDNLSRAESIAATLSRSGIQTEAVSDPEPYIWDKQFLKVALKPVAALTELKNGPMLENPETRAAMKELIEETLEVAKATGVNLLSDDPVSDILDMDIASGFYNKKSSILEDVENEQLTEIKSINGAVVTLGERYGIDTPYNRIATQLVKGKEFEFS